MILFADILIGIIEFVDWLHSYMLNAPFYLVVIDIILFFGLLSAVIFYMKHRRKQEDKEIKQLEGIVVIKGKKYVCPWCGYKGHYHNNRSCDSCFKEFIKA